MGKSEVSANTALSEKQDPGSVSVSLASRHAHSRMAAPGPAGATPEVRGCFILAGVQRKATGPLRVPQLPGGCHGPEVPSFHSIPIAVLSTCTCTHACTYVHMHAHTHPCHLLLPSFVIFTIGSRQQHSFP